MKILVAVDGSACSDAAIEEVAARTWPPKTEVKVITAAETPFAVGMEPWMSSPAYFDHLQQSVHDAADRVIENALTKLRGARDPSLKLSGEIIEGPPRQVIVEEADKVSADLIVMGSRGLNTWNRLLLGSVSDSVVHHANCSVEIVRARHLN